MLIRAHQDAIAGLPAKNAPLVPQQPVVTTVLYEWPAVDSGKEVVLWRPVVNFQPLLTPRTTTTTPKDDKCRAQSEYAAARAVPTTHGMMHVQHAGLQRHAQHGIFHNPRGNDPEQQPRQGYRVAITARIAKPDAVESLRPFRHQYCATLGPEGQVKLPRSTATGE